MEKKLFHRISEGKKRIIIPVVIGLFLGPLILGLPLALVNWVLPKTFNYFFGLGIVVFQELVVFILGSIFLGELSVLAVGSSLRNQKDALIAGGLSGAATGFTYSCLLLIIYFPPSDYTYLVVFLPISLVAASILFQGIGAYLQYIWKNDGKNAGISLQKPKMIKAIILKPVAFILIVLILVIFIPYCIAFAGFQIGLLEEKNPYRIVHISEVKQHLGDFDSWVTRSIRTISVNLNLHSNGNSGPAAVFPILQVMAEPGPV
jgi:hypothetical protein